MPTRIPWDSPKRDHGQLHADFAAIARAVQSRGHPKPGSSGDGEITICGSAPYTHTVYVGKFKRTGEWYGHCGKDRNRRRRSAGFRHPVAA